MDRLRSRWAPRKATREQYKKILDIRHKLKEKPATLLNTTLAETKKDIYKERG